MGLLDQAFLGCLLPRSRGVDSSGRGHHSLPILVGSVGLLLLFLKKICYHTDKLSCQKGCYFWVKGDSAGLGLLPARTHVGLVPPTRPDLNDNLGP